MCGIAAHFTRRGDATPLDLRLIHHRGPDSSGEWRSESGAFWLGNTRLAIMDLSPCGAQPMRDPATGNVIVVNGEIYNHLTLREQLGPEVPWRGTSDTETLLQAYARWHHGMLERLKGMFAFAIYDHARQELFVARDRLGIKPLYYTCDTDGVRFASEVKVLTEGRPSSAAPRTISGYLQWGACPERNLLYPEVRVLPAGHAMTLPLRGEPKTWRYWPSRPVFASPSTDAAGSVRRLLEKAVEEHLLADVPVASFLSGGIDSSIITALAAQKLSRPLQTFSVGFDLEEFDESSIAQEVASRYRTDHHSIRLSEEEVIHSVTEAVEKLDLPSVDAINTYIVSRAVAAAGVKVALSGLGGDELFGGYASFRDVPRLRLLARLPRSVLGALGRFAKLGDRLADIPSGAGVGDLARWRRRFVSDRTLADAGLPIATTAFECPVDLPDEYATVSWAELTGYMRRMLLRDSDQMSMAVSLELRVPFLDHELVEYVLGLPAAQKQRGTGVKWLLVEACRDLLPASVYDRPKRGFVLPMRSWMQGPLAAFVATGLREASQRELLPETFVREMSAAFERDELHWTRLWSIVVLGHFARRTDLRCSADEDTAIHSLG
ncbi:MAG: asparagine synthase (glutamine-hydrolyzing) [Verrucomicrobiota bacterium]|nr:asparagine synthase (glutamine-hydrolyzing) [Verrucomicrobiota bacterium]